MNEILIPLLVIGLPLFAIALIYDSWLSDQRDQRNLQEFHEIQNFDRPEAQRKRISDDFVRFVDASRGHRSLIQKSKDRVTKYLPGPD